MSTNNRPVQSAQKTTQAESPWQGKARETWVSMAVAAATASLRQSTAAAGEVTDSGSGPDAV